MYEKNENPKKPVMINQGSYGCVYYPGLSCSRNYKDPAASKYITKLQKKTFTSENEKKLGKKIQDVPNYELYFAPIVKTCDIHLAAVNNQYIKDCEVVGKDRKAAYEIQKIAYIDGMDLYDYIMHFSGVSSAFKRDTTNSETPTESIFDHSYSSMKKPKTEHDGGDEEEAEDADDAEEAEDAEQEEETPSFSPQEQRRTMAAIFDTYTYLVNTLQMLQNENIIHYDFKYNNVFVDKHTGSPIILDLGLSIPVDTMLATPFDEADRDVIDYYKQYFYDFGPEYYVWPIEAHVINYVLHVSEKMDERGLQSLCNEFVASNKGLAYYSTEFKDLFIQLAVDTFKPYVGAPRTRIINELIEKTWKTWDNYSLSVCYLGLLFKILQEFKSQPIPLDFEGIVPFTKLLLENIHPDASRRHSLEKTLDLFSELKHTP